MTISNANRKAGPFSGNGVTVAFPFTFKVFKASDVLVVQAVAGVETTEALTADYTVTLNADQNANPGGTITMLSAPATGTTITATSQVANLQPMDLTNAGGFYPAVINDALDRSTVQIQQLAEGLSRAVKVPISGTQTGEEFSASLFAAEANAGGQAAAAATSAAAAAASVVTAAASSASALGYLQAYRATSYGALAADPLLDPTGAPPTVGDEYFNTTANLIKRFNGMTWQASDISTANLASPSGSSLVTHLPAGIGAVPQSIQAELREHATPSPKKFGAVGDGVSNDTSALQLWANAATGVIRLDGDYLVDRTILFQNKTGVVITGTGTITGKVSTWEFTVGYRGVLTFLNCIDSGAADGLKVTGVRKSNVAATQPWEDGDSGIEFINCTRPVSRKVATDNTMVWGILANGCTEPDVDTCKITNVTRQSGVNIAVGGSSNGKVRNTLIGNVGLYGIESESAEFAVGHRYSNNVIRSCYKGIALVSANRDVMAFGNTVEDCLYAVTVNNLGGYDTSELLILHNDLKRNWRSIEFAGAKKARAIRNSGSCIIADAYMHQSSYHSVHSVTGSNTFTVINFLGDVGVFAISSTLLLLNVEYTITAVSTSTIASYGAIATLTVTPPLPAGLSEGEMFKRKVLASGTVGFIGAAVNTLSEVSNNDFHDAALAFQFRGAGSSVEVLNNHTDNCPTLFWFDTTAIGNYHVKGGTHSGSLTNCAIGDIATFSANGDIEGKKQSLFFLTKTASTTSKAYYQSSDVEIIFAISVVLTDSACTGISVLNVAGSDISIFNPGDYVASGDVQKTVFLTTPVRLAPNTAFTLNLLDTVGNLAFKSAHVTLHIL